MANKRIKDLTQTATTLASDDYVAIDGSSNGTRKIVKSDLVNDISSQVAGTYLDEANNLSDVASLDTSKLNLEVPDVGTAPNEVPLNGMLGSMAFQSSEGISVGTVEAETLEVESTTGTATTQALTVTDGSSTNFVVQEDGKTGIGTATPDAPIDCSGSSAHSEYAHFSNNNQRHLKLSSFSVGGNTNAGHDINASSSVGALSLSTGGSAAVTIDSSQRVGIGTSSPDRALHLYSSSVATVLKLDSAGADTALEFAHSDTVAAGINCSTGGDLEFRTGSNSSANRRWTINSTGNLVANGTGIDFGSGATLDAYEEGTFTPVVADAVSGGNVGSASTANGRYTKIGRVVHFELSLIDIDTTGMTAGNTLHIRGLPFDSNSSAPQTQVTAKTDNVTFTDSVMGSVTVGSSAIFLNSVRSGLSDVQVAVSQYATGVADVFLSGSYTTD